jgi:TRAP transporter 4TM/12TM fusion protein
MKRTGIPAALAGATEASASMGGQVTPPVMGAVAFIMAEFLGISYISIITAAAIPALLYYVSVFTMIHFEAHKIGAWGLKKSEIDPTWKHDILTKGYLILPVVMLVYMLVRGYTAMAACFYSFIVAVLLSFFRKDTRLTLGKFKGIFEQAGMTLCVVAVPSAIAGFVEGTATLTGLTPHITKVLTELSHSNLYLTLIITMLMCLVLGMGVPTVANYILMTIMTVPTMISVGVMPLAAHLFCFYFGIMSELTPPVAITSYTAAAIAGAPFWPTAFNAVRLAAVAYIVPYIFVFNTSLLLGTQPFTIGVIWGVVTAAFGSCTFAIGMAGFIRRKMFLIERFAICAFAVLMIVPTAVTDIVGIAGVLFIIAMQWIYKKNPKNYVPPVRPEHLS